MGGNLFVTLGEKGGVRGKIFWKGGGRAGGGPRTSGEKKKKKTAPGGGDTGGTPQGPPHGFSGGARGPRVRRGDRRGRGPDGKFFVPKGNFCLQTPGGGGGKHAFPRGGKKKKKLLGRPGGGGAGRPWAKAGGTPGQALQPLSRGAGKGGQLDPGGGGGGPPRAHKNGFFVRGPPWGGPPLSHGLGEFFFFFFFRAESAPGVSRAAGKDFWPCFVGVRGRNARTGLSKTVL